MSIAITYPAQKYKEYLDQSNGLSSKPRRQKEEYEYPSMSRKYDRELHMDDQYQQDK